MYYIGLGVHKKTISYCVKDVSGQVHREGQIGATRRELDGWMKTLSQPWTVAMEATIFTGWIYDHLLPHAQQIKMAHPLMLHAIAAAKKKNDRIDVGKIADCLRCDFLPECHMASTAIRDRRRTLRYRHLLARQMVQMKNRISGLLMETGVSDNKQRLHKVHYFRELLSSNEEVNESIRPLLSQVSAVIGPTPWNGPEASDALGQQRVPPQDYGDNKALVLSSAASALGVATVCPSRNMMATPLVSHATSVARLGRQKTKVGLLFGKGRSADTGFAG
jgi:hypothetical protein